MVKFYQTTVRLVSVFGFWMVRMVWQRGMAKESEEKNRKLQF